MTNLKWNEVKKYDRKIIWNKQNLNIPELEQEVLIFFPDTDNNCRKSNDRYGRIIIGYFYLTSREEIAITDGESDYGHIREGIKWAEYNRPSQPDKQVKMCNNFVCEKYDMRTGSKCNEISCQKCDDGNCKNCKRYLTQSPQCENCKIW